MSFTPEPSREGRVAGVDVCEGAGAAPCSELYKAPVPFQGRSLEGAPGGDDRKELARSLDAELPVEDLLPAEPRPDDSGMRSIVICDPACDVTCDAKGDANAFVERRRAYAKNIGTLAARNRDAARFGVCTQTQTRQAANGRWAALASANRTAPDSFGDDPSRIPPVVEHDTASLLDRGGQIVDPALGAEFPNTLDRSHATHYVPELRGSKTDRETGFGRISTDRNALAFSCRERILNALSSDEFAALARIATLESGVEDGDAACGMLPSSQYRAMVDLVTDARGVCGDRRRPLRGSRGRRFRQLVKMLDHAATVV